MEAFVHRLILSVCFCAICLGGNAQTTIQMEEYGGVYRIPCKVNGAKMKLIFDTGAGNVCLSLSMAEYLLDNDFISSADIIGKGSSTVADGRIVDHVEINIKDIEIEGIHLYNVRAVVIEGQNAPLLMGQSAIQKLGPIEINRNILTIRNGESNSDELIDRLFNEASQAYGNGLFGRAEEKYSQLYSMNQLSDYGIYLYANCCRFNDDANKAAELLSQINDYSYFEKEKIDIYRVLGDINKKLENYYEAAKYYKLSSKKIQTEKKEWFLNFMEEGDCYYHMQYYEDAINRYIDAGYIFAEIYNVDYEYIIRDCENKLKRNEKSYRNDDIDWVTFQIGCCMKESGEVDNTSFLYLMTKLARAKNRYAMQMCNSLAVNPYDDIWYR